MKIGSKAVADDVKILDVLEGTNAGAASYAEAYMQRIDGITLADNQVAYYATNSKGEISELILKNVTGDAYTYGLITSGYNDDKGYASIEADGKTYTASFSNLAFGCGAQLVIDSATGTVKNAYKLPSYAIGKSNLTASAAYSGNNVYRISDKVKVYLKTGTQFSMISLNEAVSGDYHYTCYYDKSDAKGGRIRVIVAEKAD